MKNVHIALLIILFAVIVGGIILFRNSLFAGQNHLETIAPQEFFSKWQERKKDAVLIDVRTPMEFNAGRYKGAINIDFYSPDFKAKLSKLDKNKQYFIYCRSGSRAQQALEIMRKLGFKEVYNLKGGIAGSPDLLPIEE